MSNAGSVQEQMDNVWNKSRSAFFRRLAKWTILSIAAIIVTVLIFAPSIQIDRRNAPASAYNLMSTWMSTPIQNGVDLTSLHPMIREAMEDGYVYMGEWRNILDAKHELERLYGRGKLIRELQ